MLRIAVVVVASLGLGAAGMWLTSNFKLRLEPVGEVAISSEPWRLPAAIADRAARTSMEPDGNVVPAGGGQPAQPVAAVTGAAPTVEAIKAADAISKNRIVITHLLDGESGEQLSWPNPENSISLRTRKLKIQFRWEKAEEVALDKIQFEVAFGKVVLKSESVKSKGECEFDLSSSTAEFAGRNPVEIRATRENTVDQSRVPLKLVSLSSNIDTPAIKVTLPGASAVAIAKVFNGRFDGGVAKSGNSAIAVFDGYLRVQLQPAASTAEYDFFLFDAVASGVRNLLATGRSVESRTVGKSIETVVDWDKAPPVKGGLLLVVRERAIGTNAHSMDTAVLNVSASPELPKVEFAASPVKPASDGQSVPKKSAQVHLLGTEKVNIEANFAAPGVPARLLLYVDQNSKDKNTIPRAILPVASSETTKTFSAVDLGTDGDHVVVAVLEAGGVTGPETKPLDLRVRRGGLNVSRVSPTDFSNTTDYKIRIAFNTSNPVDPSTVTAANFSLKLDNAGDNVLASGNPLFDASSNTVTIQAKTPLAAGQYVLTALGTDDPDDGTKRKGLRDIFGNPLGAAFGETGVDFTTNIVQPVGGQQPSVVTSAFSLSTGPNVEFKEFEPRKVFLNGFNPADRVETRVVRLYYNRDAARVVQVVNRDAKAFNAQSVDVRRRAADRSRDNANKATDDRKIAESQAVQAATEARAAENKLKDLQSKLNAARGEAAAATAQIGQRQQAGDAAASSANAIQNELRSLQAVVTAANAKEQSLQSDIATAMAEVQAKRAREVELTLKARELDQQELRARETQFRSEVAAAREDADIYAPGKPESFDPVRQCSLSVIGEGLIQIRGPIKGVNIIRTMINQIDAPTGQVRIGVHTVQVNGERVDRMNRVVANIQRYLDHSRFLTSQSSQMLRKAVTAVAARKAEECHATLAPGCTQADRDAKYLHCFFGKDFIDELRQLDSEFLRTGNKLLSLHSMDSTSLSAALTLLALAKNDIRAEILQEFETQTRTKLPEAEQGFYLAGLACPTKCEACFDKKFCMLAYNARFESFRGFFNLEIQGSDTLTPVQREFVRLAQIFKTRLVTELELKQRVVERSLVEERLGNYQEELETAKKKEALANGVLDEVRKERQAAMNSLASVLAQKFTEIVSEVNADVDFAIADFHELDSITIPNAVNKERNSPKRSEKVELDLGGGRKLVAKDIKAFDGKSDAEFYLKGFDKSIDQFERALRTFKKFIYTSPDASEALKYLESIQVKIDAYRKKPADGLLLQIVDFKKIGDSFDILHTTVKRQLRSINDSVGTIMAGLKNSKADANKLYIKYRELVSDAINRISDSGMKGEIEKARDKVDRYFAALLTVEVKFSQATEAAQLARRPLDEKKLLDMLIDEMEDKYIELLDGTRAHTANVDNYLKALSTALDDDFNTQFYQPAFSKIRSLGAGWDVQLGQIESTSVLTNNRVFAKVSPAASMEFDLPKRDIFIKEAFKGAKAAVDEYGALLSDPTFLSLAKMYGGTPTAATFGAGGSPAVRGVLPGQSSTADEMLMAQAGSNRKEFGAALEALIPDPAVYKFETGTGYEIRPVMSPDGQAVVFGFDYLYTTDVREPVRADEKHLGRVKRHFVHTDVQLSNFEMREVSKYWVSLKAARTGRGVALLQDVPGVGALFRPLPSASSSLQQNLIYSQATLFPTLFDLMGLRYAPAIADIDPEFTKNDEFVVRGRRDHLRMFIFDYGASRVDDALRILTGERRPDLYRSQHTIPWQHPNGYRGPGMRQRDAILEEGYDPRESYPKTEYNPGMLLPNAAPAPGHFGTPTTIYEEPSKGGGGTKGTSSALPPPVGGGYSDLPVGAYEARPIRTTITPQPGPKAIRAPGAPSIPPPGTPLPFPQELPK